MQILLGDVEARRRINCKTIKTDDFGPFFLILALVDRQHGQLLGPLVADPAEILRGKWAWVWLGMMQILLGHVEKRGRSGWKTGPAVAPSLAVRLNKLQLLRPRVSSLAIPKPVYHVNFQPDWPPGGRAIGRSVGQPGPK